MKKIVALVLSLALALSLCTVAFAVKDGDTLYDGQSVGAKAYTYVDASTYKAGEKNNIAYLTDGTDTYAIGGAGDTTLWVDVTKKADITLGDETSKLFYEYKAEAVAKQAWSCTTDRHAAGYKFVNKNDDTIYAVKCDKEDADFALLVDGKIVYAEVDETYLPGQHVLAVPTAGAKEVGVGVYEAYCCACKKTVQVSWANINGSGYLYENENDAWFWNWIQQIKVAIPVGYEPLFGQWYVVDGGAAANTETGVTSAKTFDAGIAMYAGMALMSVAGSAVVIGKKKEF